MKTIEKIFFECLYHSFLEIPKNNDLLDASSKIYVAGLYSLQKIKKATQNILRRNRLSPFEPNHQNGKSSATGTLETGAAFTGCAV